jgi:hypothetical protein
MTAADHAARAKALRHAANEPGIGAGEQARLLGEAAAEQAKAVTDYCADRHDASEAVDS